MNMFGKLSLLVCMALMFTGLFLYSSLFNENGINNIGSYLIISSLFFAYLADKNRIKKAIANE